MDIRRLLPEFVSGNVAGHSVFSLFQDGEFVDWPVLPGPMVAPKLLAGVEQYSGLGSSPSVTSFDCTDRRTVFVSWFER